MDFQLLPERPGTIAIVTGANTGLGFETTRYFALKKICTVMACRTPERGEAARRRIQEEIPGAKLQVLPLDLADLSSVRAFAETFKSGYDHLDLLVNNAGIMWTPYSKTVDGFEIQLASNYIGHFLLTRELLEHMPDRRESRIVIVSSLAHYQSPRRIRFEDLHWENGYNKFHAYAQTNLARLLFMRQLDARLKAAGRKMLAVAAHPGMSETELGRTLKSWQVSLVRYTVGPFLSHPPREAALPQVMAALSSRTQGGDYFGPQGLGEMSGPPGHARIHPCAQDDGAAQQLWRRTEEMVGGSFEALHR